MNTKENMIHHHSLAFPNWIGNLHEVQNNAATPDPVAPANATRRGESGVPGAIESVAYLEKPETGSHHPTLSTPNKTGRVSESGDAADAPRNATRAGGPITEEGRMQDAPRGSLRSGGATSEGADAKPYQPGDLPVVHEPLLTRKQIRQLIRQLLKTLKPINIMKTHTIQNNQNSRSNRHESAPNSEGAQISESAVSQVSNLPPSPHSRSAASQNLCKSAQSVVQMNSASAPSVSSAVQNPSAFSLQNSAFQLLQPDWIELSPYGDFPHPRGIQRVDREAADLIAAHFNSFWARLGRRFAGVPLFIGHPDVPEFQNEYPDKKAYGWICELQVRNSGLFGRVKWSEAGLDLLQNAHYKFYSPYWEAKYVGEQDRKKIYRPTALISVGLTNQPNLPVLPLSNSQEVGRDVPIAPSQFVDSPGHTTPYKNPNSPRKTDPQIAPIHSELISTGSSAKFAPSAVGNFSLSATGGEGQGEVENPHSDTIEEGSSHSSRPSPLTPLVNSHVVPPLGGPEIPHSPFPNPQFPPIPLANEVLALQTLLHQRDERIHALHAQFENARSTWTQTQSQLQDEIATLRGAIDRLENSRIEIVLDQALAKGRLAPAERPFWNEQLKRDFDTRFEELKSRPEVFHTESVTGQLGKNRIDLSNAQTRQRIVHELVAAKQKLGLSYHDAWCAVQQERPDIFAAMSGPSTSATQ